MAWHGQFDRKRAYLAWGWAGWWRGLWGGPPAHIWATEQAGSRLSPPVRMGEGGRQTTWTVAARRAPLRRASRCFGLATCGQRTVVMCLSAIFKLDIAPCRPASCYSRSGTRACIAANGDLQFSVVAAAADLYLGSGSALFSHAWNLLLLPTLPFIPPEWLPRIIGGWERGGRITRCLQGVILCRISVPGICLIPTRLWRRYYRNYGVYPILAPTAVTPNLGLLSAVLLLPASVTQNRHGVRRWHGRTTLYITLPFRFSRRRKTCAAGIRRHAPAAAARESHRTFQRRAARYKRDSPGLVPPTLLKATRHLRTQRCVIARAALLRRLLNW